MRSRSRRGLIGDDLACRERTPVADAFDFVEHRLVLVARPYEVRVQRMRLLAGSTVMHAARNACATTWPPYSRPQPSTGPDPRNAVRLHLLVEREYGDEIAHSGRSDGEHGADTPRRAMSRECFVHFGQRPA